MCCSLAISVVDLRRGGVASAAHGLAAVYIGVSLAFGHQMIGWADQRFAHRFAGGPVPLRPPRTGRAHAAHERRQWLRHLLAYVVAAAVLGLFTALVGDLSRVAPLWAVMAPWGIGVVVDFVVLVQLLARPAPTAGHRRGPIGRPPRTGRSRGGRDPAARPPRTCRRPSRAPQRRRPRGAARHDAILTSRSRPVSTS